MIILSEEVKEFFEEYNRLVDSSQNFAIFVRDIDLQKIEITNLEKYIQKGEDLKTNKELFAEADLNLILFLIISADAVKCELSMIVHLKNNEMDSAWAYLVQAQTNVSIAARNHPFDGDHLNGYVSRLEAYEKLLFPKMMFNSVGGIIREAKCSICKRDYDECDHIKGKIYKGDLCVREIHKMDLEEVSIVKNPANKLCRQLTITNNGKEIDLMTLKEKTTDNI